MSEYSKLDITPQVPFCFLAASGSSQAMAHESSRIFRTDVRYASSALTSGIAKGSQPFAWGAGLCPASLFPRVACGDARKRGFCGDTPHPGRDAALPAPSLFRISVSKIRDDSCSPLLCGVWIWQPEAAKSILHTQGLANGRRP